MPETAEDFAALLEQAATRQPSSNFAGVVLADERTVTLYWKGGEGNIPADFRDQYLQPGLDRGIAFDIQPALHSAAELRQQRDAIRNDAGFAMSGITVMALEPDGSGLYIAGDPARASELEAVRNSKVPLHFDPETRVRPAC